MKTLIVGKNSFIAKTAYQNINDAEKISYGDIDKVNLNEYNTILNCAITNEYRTEVYDEEKDLDIQLARIAEQYGMHYVMISTRKVYGTSNDLKTYDEESELNPNDRYGENKLISEYKIMDLMESCTILRASNVFGYEPDRKSFMGFCMNQLRDTGKIVYDINPYNIRDFIDVDTFARILALVCELKPNGFYNVGSNLGLTVGDVSRYLIKGFGSGELDAKSDKFFDQFVLDNSKLKSDLEMDISSFNFEKIISKLGKRLYEDRI